VVGLSCRFAGADSAQAYWQLLAEGRSGIARVPAQRWGRPSEYFAGVLPEVWQFDAGFFLIAAADARAMDPQGLLVLEESLRTWYHAGYTLKQVKGRAIGVYLGARSQHLPEAGVLGAAPNPIMAVGANYLAANISRFFDLSGPSVVIDTACSSALVAMSMAMQSLKSGEIESALVGGVSVLHNEGALRLFARRGILSEGGAFHLFDGRAHGAVLGEGAGMVWLKSVSQARSDGDTIYAVIKALALNNDGRTAGPGAPNLQGQQEVMRQGLARSGLQGRDISYIEVNGSGSEVTDLLELKAIEAVYRADSGLRCELGSMKPNIGHPLCAEGIASFIKSVLMLHKGERVPFLSGQVPMQHYDLGASPFRFYRAGEVPGPVLTRAGINCFADGGTNAHVILEAWREGDAPLPRHRPLAPPQLNKVDCRLHHTDPVRLINRVEMTPSRNGSTSLQTSHVSQRPTDGFWGWLSSPPAIEEPAETAQS
jgi:acyl transferase domain-containing protein